MDASTITQRAFAAHESGDLDEAEKLFSEIEKMVPEDPNVQHQMGIIKYQQEKHQEAISHIKRAIAVLPDRADFHCNMALPLHALQRLDEAIAYLEIAVSIDPDDANAHNNLGAMAYTRKRWQVSIEHFEKAINLNGPNSDWCCNLGYSLFFAGEYSRSVEAFQQSVHLGAENFLACKGLGLAALRTGQFEIAVETFSNALQLRDDDSELFLGLAQLSRYQGEFEKSIEYFNRAIELDPSSNELKCDLATTLHCQGNHDASLQVLEQILVENPDDAKSHFNRAIGLLTVGHMLEGWAEYEWRWESNEIKKPQLLSPQWTPGQMNEEEVLLIAEQGIGDTLQFVRYADEVRRQGGKVVLAVQPPLVPLLQLQAGFERVISVQDRLPCTFSNAFLMSMPNILQSDLDSIPCNVPYLKADAGLVEKWQSKVRGTDQLQVGVVWEGNPLFRYDRIRTPALKFFESLARNENVRLVNLLKTTPPETSGEKSPIVCLGDDLDGATGPFMDTAAIMMNLDVVISIDTFATHLAGALGVPTFLVLGVAGDWRWLKGREDSPWYPSLQIFRQQEIGDWEALFEVIADKLQAVLKGDALLPDHRDRNLKVA